MDTDAGPRTRLSRPGWLIDEVGSAGRENLDADHVRRYDVKEDASGTREVAVLQTWGLDAESHVVDLGAGTGQFTLAVAPACARVVAVDVSSVMLEVLRAKLETAPVSNVDVVQAGFLTYEHHGRDADFVYSRYALHHLPDFWKAVALQRARRMLRPGGILRLWDVVYHFDPGEAEEHIEAWCATGGGAAGEGATGEGATGDQGGDETSDVGWSRAELEEHVRDEHSTFTWLLEPMIERAGFAIEDATYSPDGMLATYVARAKS